MEDNKNIKEAPKNDKAPGACEENAPKKDKKQTKPTNKELTERVLALEAEIKEKDDKYLRMAAEYDNFRRRSREEKDATYENAMADTVAELLPIIDNLERASQFGTDDTVKAGLEMIIKSVDSVFAKLGIEAVGKVGDTFDPQLHNAVMHGEDENLGEGEIVEVYQKGYKKGKKIIRFAMVKTVN